MLLRVYSDGRDIRIQLKFKQVFELTLRVPPCLCNCRDQGARRGGALQSFPCRPGHTLVTNECLNFKRSFGIPVTTRNQWANEKWRGSSLGASLNLTAHP